MSDIAKLAAALAKAQGQIEGAKKDRKNDHFRSKYADLASCWDACREPLSSNGLSVVQFPCPSLPGHVGLRTLLLHESGEMIEDVFHMPVKDATNPQAVGSALTYARRYALCSVVGIAPEEDDGNAAAGTIQKPAATRASYDPNQVNKAAKELEKQFETGDLDTKKKTFLAAKAANLPEELKLNLLTKFSEAIKAAQPQGVK